MGSVRSFGRRAAVVGVLVVAFGVGCNAILDNQPGVLDAEDEGSAAAPPAHDRGSSSQPSAPASPVVGSGPEGAAPTSSAADAGTSCAAGTKSCIGVCVPVIDPRFGCGERECAPCEVPNAISACSAGACAVGVCADGFADCNRDAGDGCEVDLSRDLTSCGACGHACPTLDHVLMTCTGAQCMGACEPGFADCNLDPDDGCERNLLKDKRNCGECGRRCVFGRCEEGACVL
jgi:hypothetical protein